ncbi:MAG: anaerobic C4-dicarboxylate transporter [Bacteroidales bacterium]|nr:anaerobic C4-dicarboxylate transporter [Bacteroidales bacterium]
MAETASTAVILIQFVIVLALILIGARQGGLGLGIYGMVGVFILVFGFGMAPGKVPLDVMLIIVSVITAASVLQATGGLDYLVDVAARFLRKHPSRITYFGPLVCWLFCIVAGTAHTCYSLLPIISDVATRSRIRPEKPLSVSVIAASLGITSSPVSAATAAIISTDLLGGSGLELIDVLIVAWPSSFIAILIASWVQNRIGKDLTEEQALAAMKHGPKIQESASAQDPVAHRRARNSVWAFLFGVALVILLGSCPSLRPVYDTANGPVQLTMAESIEIVMMAATALIIIVGKPKIQDAVRGNVFAAGMTAVVAIFGIAWMGDTYFGGHLAYFKEHIEQIVTHYPYLFSVALFIMSIMLFSQAATVRTLYPLGLGLGISPWALLAMYPAVNGYFFLPNYPTTVAAISFDPTGTTRVGRYLINHSFQLAGFITTIVSISLGALIVTFLH